MSKYQMWPERLLDLYQYLIMYQRTYADGEADRLIEIVTQKYYEDTGKDITKAGNPRRAGRKPLYDQDKADEVIRAYKASGSVTKAAAACGVSTTFVYKCLNDRFSN